MVNCKVCQVLVRRLKYPRSVCEACRKFFRRNVDQRENLVCFQGHNNCDVSFPQRRSCLRCRLQKCIDVGMQRKIVKATSESGQESDQSASTFSATMIVDNLQTELSPTDNYGLVPFVQDPQLFDGGAVELILTAAMQASTVLHNFEFMRFSIPNSWTDINAIPDLLVKHVQEIFQTSLSYGKFFLNALGIDEANLLHLNQGYVRQLPRFYGVLPSYGATKKLGLSLEVFQHYIPELQELAIAEDELATCLKDWNPQFTICSLLFSLLLFNENAVNIPALVIVRNDLFTALQLCLSRLSGDDHEAYWNHLEISNQCLHKTNYCTFMEFNALTAISSHYPAFSSVVSVFLPFN